MASWRLAPWAERTLVAVVAAILLTPGLATLAGLDHERVRDAVIAAPTATAWGTRLADAARTFGTRFAFRGRLVRAQAAFRYHLFGVSPLPTVLRGRDGWWYYADDGSIDDTTLATPFTDADLEEWRRTLQRTADWLRARGIAYVFVLVPDKPTIYPEFLPAALRRDVTRTSRADQLVTLLRTRTTVPVVDLRAPLLAAKAGDRIYHRTDTHWNDRGAVVGYRAIIEALRAQTPRVGAAFGDDRFRRETRQVPGLDLPDMAGLAAATTETDLALVPRPARRARVVEPLPAPPAFVAPRLTTMLDDPALPRALFYRDSFGSALVPFLAEHFQRTVVLWEYDVVPDTVRTERPDVVIQEWAGRRLYTRLPFDAVAADPAAAAEIAAASIGPSVAATATAAPAISNSPAARR